MEAALSQLDLNKDAELMFICLGKNGVDKTVGRGRMFFPGFERNPSRMAQYYRASDVFIHAVKAEAFGKTITEALACGVPVVATAVGGIPEQIENGRTGLLVPPGDSAAMVAAIRRLLADANLRFSLGEAGVADMKHRFGLERQVNAFLDWYQEIIEDWRRTPEYALPNLR